MYPRAFFCLALALLPIVPGTAAGQAPMGLAAAALANPDYEWVRRAAPGFRVYFVPDSYPARHQDSLVARLGPALDHATRLLGAPRLESPIDLFFVESRPQMESLVGGRATGFAHTAARAVFLMTNPDWRAFERHEIMHVAAVQAWGPAAAGTDWLQEGLAQFADGDCAGFSNADVLLALVRVDGWIPFDDVLARFRSQPDLRAYLQAAAFTGHLHQRYGPQVLRELWTAGATADTRVEGERLADIERTWRQELRAAAVPGGERLERIRSVGCG